MDSFNFSFVMIAMVFWTVCVIRRIAPKSLSWPRRLSEEKTASDQDHQQEQTCATRSRGPRLANLRSGFRGPQSEKTFLRYGGKCNNSSTAEHLGCRDLAWILGIRL
jgi:hypothetical protein